MLKPYNYSYSKIQKVQSFVNHVMLDVIFNAKNIAAVTFSSILVLPKYRNLIDGINNDYVLTPLAEAYIICKTLNRTQIKLLKTAVYNNNKIRELCNGDIEPVKYDQIEAIDVNLKKAIKTFCDSLYDHCIKRAPFYTEYEDINAYYKTVVKKSSVCKCCGIHKVLTQFHTHRSALDHYLPRKHYPFNSLNFKNLIPICDICNGKYKLSEDTLYITNNKGKKNESKTRTVAFYPYSRTTHDIEIDITFNKAFDSTIEPEDIEIDITSTGSTDKITSWDRIFGIKENFKAECCTDEMRMYYEEQYIADMNFGKTHEQYIDILERNKYGDMNFLKIPFLKAINK
ncbi:hypothetical protein [uncultured Algoriphagus sp.]|uniref:hypothetical protein n=1 Tax=uncultured Algoriphagus sp. TaxID=417365 RepID=UPI0030ED81D1